MPKTYVTFGQNHVHSVNGNTFDKDTVAVIEAEDRPKGRAEAWKLFGDKFFTTYYEDEWDSEKMSYFPKGLISTEDL